MLEKMGVPQQQEKEMAGTARLWSISQLATELAKNPRTITKALANVPADGVLKGGHKGWFMSSAFEAMRRYTETSDQLTDRTALRSTESRIHTEALIDQIETSAARVEVLMQRLRSAPTLEDRRKILETDGKVVGMLDRAFQQQLAADDVAEIHRPFTDRVIQQLLGEISDLCGLQLASR
jgi:DNA-binding transcriptional regulator YhcF (GntR family)